MPPLWPGSCWKVTDCPQRVGDSALPRGYAQTMPYYRVVGEIPRKRHIQFRRPDGGLYAEELMGEEGFTSDSSLLYHRYPPTAILKSEGVEVAAAALTPNLPLQPRAYRTQDLPVGGDLVLGRHLLFGNDDVRISFVAAHSPASSTATPWATRSSTSSPASR